MAGLAGTHFRSLKSTTKQNRLRAWAWSELVLDVTAEIAEHVELPVVDLELSPLAVGATTDEVHGVVAGVREQWGLGDGPIGHLVRHMERHGIVVCRLPIVDVGIDAFSHYEGSRPVVILGTNKDDAARSRFDAAHELGHLICHPDADPGGTQEQQAHAFAAELLMPRDHMVRLLPRRFHLGTYVRLKHEWGVSVRALLYRAHALELITDAAYRRGVVYLNSEFGGRNEPSPLRAFDDPALLGNAMLLLEQSGISTADVANAAGMPVSDVDLIVAGSRARPRVAI